MKFGKEAAKTFSSAAQEATPSGFYAKLAKLLQ
jgi:hypothetical protein